MTGRTIGPCLCGDTACPSCGPAQGHDPIYEMVIEFLGELFFPDDADEVELPTTETAFLEFVADNLARIDLTRKAVTIAAQRWRDHLDTKAKPKT